MAKLGQCQFVFGDNKVGAESSCLNRCDCLETSMIKIRSRHSRIFQRRPVDGEILRLALPAFGALIAEPLFLLADSAMIGHLGETPLAGLGLASAILQTIFALMVFLAYNTTPAVARLLGQGDPRSAVAVGIDGLWFALALGIALGAAGWFATPLMVAAFGAEAAVSAQAVIYLRISMLGVPAMLLIFAATGLLRGLQDTRTPLVVSAIGFSSNIALNYMFIYVLGQGIAGAAVGTVLAQLGMLMGYLVVVERHVRREGASPWPQRAGVLIGATAGGWLFLCKLTMRVALLLAMYVATSLGSSELAAFQVIILLHGTLAFGLAALAIAAQALVGRALGAGDIPSVKAILRRCLEWGLSIGMLLGILVILSNSVLGKAFTNAEMVLELMPTSMILVGLSAPIGAVVWVLDGVLIGAGDVRYLALAGFINLGAFIPLAIAILLFEPVGSLGLAWLTAAFVFGFFGVRLATLGVRARSNVWMVPGAL